MYLIKKMMLQNFKKFSQQVNFIGVIDHARAGNCFFLTIFDQHNEVLSCPWLQYVYSFIITTFGDNDKLDSKYVLEKWPKQQYFKLIHSEIDDDAKNFIKRIGGNPYAKINRKIVRNTFSDILSLNKYITRHDLVIATYYAYALGVGRNPKTIKYIMTSDAISLRSESVFSGYSGKVIDFIFNDFPNAYIVHLIRDPRACVASVAHQFINQLGNMYGINATNAFHRIYKIINLKFERDSVFVFGFWLMYYSQTYRAIMRKKNQYSSHFICVRNEDLNLSFCETMRYLSCELKINYFSDWNMNENFQPTMLKDPWKGVGAFNSQYSPSTRLENDPHTVSLHSTGPNRHVTERWKSKLKKNEILLIEKFLSHEFSSFGYELQNNRFSKWRWMWALFKPLRGELPCIRWLANGWKSGKEIFRDRLFYTFVWPLYYILVRWAFVRVVNNTCVFKKDCFTDKNSAHEK